MQMVGNRYVLIESTARKVHNVELSGSCHRQLLFVSSFNHTNIGYRFNITLAKWLQTEKEVNVFALF
jgi:hypothetical protein